LRYVDLRYVDLRYVDLRYNDTTNLTAMMSSQKIPRPAISSFSGKMFTDLFGQ